LREVAAAHPDETFYCVCVYFEGTYGDLILYLNVPEQARATTEGLMARFPGQYVGKSLDQAIEEEKWNAGDFRYQFYSHEDEFFEAIWAPIKAIYDRLIMRLYIANKDSESSDEESESDRFKRLAMEAACHTAIDIERGEALKLLKKSTDFRVTCVDHDETQEDSDDRLLEARATYKPLPTRGWKAGSDVDDFLD
jgi:hypothetical protein